MPPWPRISVVTSSYNQGEFIGATIESVLAQNYPALEHIVVDGLSTDDTAEVLARYPHLRVIRERDRGQADAINKGFAQATGDILCFLNSDDTLLPGALARVAEEIDPARGRHVVMGRCRFIDRAGRFTGIEHPSSFESHRRVLEVWRGHTLPQPATFWTREVWERCGPLDEHAYWLDYDLFCRFSRDYAFHPIDQVLATYRLHDESKTSSASEQERLEASIAISRRYWSGLSAGDRLGLQASYARFRLNRRQRARGHLAYAKGRWRERQPLRALWPAATGLLLAPDLVADLVIMPALVPIVRRLRTQRAVRAARAPGVDSPQTRAWRDFEGQHADGWIGPTFVTTIELSPQHTAVELEGKFSLSALRQPIVITASLDGQALGSVESGPTEVISARWPLGAVAAGPHELRLTSSGYIVPHRLFGNGDHRPLAFMLESVRPS